MLAALLATDGEMKSYLFLIMKQLMHLCWYCKLIETVYS